MFQALTEQINNLITSARRKVTEPSSSLKARKWLRNYCMQSRQKVVYQNLR